MVAFAGAVVDVACCAVADGRAVAVEVGGKAVLVSVGCNVGSTVDVGVTVGSSVGGSVGVDVAVGSGVAVLVGSVWVGDEVAVGATVTDGGGTVDDGDGVGDGRGTVGVGGALVAVAGSGGGTAVATWVGG